MCLCTLISCVNNEHVCTFNSDGICIECGFNFVNFEETIHVEETECVPENEIITSQDEDFSGNWNEDSWDNVDSWSQHEDEWGDWE